MVPVQQVARKSGKSTQFAALCYRLRKNDRHEILLITSRRTGRWIMPKGWPMKGKSPDETAAQEAFEEAGVKGSIHDMSLGRYRFGRNRNRQGHRPSEAFVFPLKVKKLASKYKEKGQRKIKWFSPETAAMLVREPKLKRIIRQFDPKSL